MICVTISRSYPLIICLTSELYISLFLQFKDFWSNLQVSTSNNITTTTYNIDHLFWGVFLNTSSDYAIFDDDDDDDDTDDDTDDDVKDIGSHDDDDD